MEVNHLDPNNLERWERIDGVIYDMTPSPSSEHQRIVGRLYLAIGAYLKGRTCEAFVSPYDVYLDNNENGQYVQPDISVICDPTKIKHKGCYGAPDMVVEVLSPTTGKKDKTVKLRAYKAAGVLEYWIIDPGNQLVEVYDLQGEIPFPIVYGTDDKVVVRIFEDLQINLADIFE